MKWEGKKEGEDNVHHSSPLRGCRRAAGMAMVVASPRSCVVIVCDARQAHPFHMYVPPPLSFLYCFLTTTAPQHVHGARTQEGTKPSPLHPPHPCGRRMQARRACQHRYVRLFPFSFLFLTYNTPQDTESHTNCLRRSSATTGGVEEVRLATVLSTRHTSAVVQLSSEQSHLCRP